MAGKRQRQQQSSLARTSIHHLIRPLDELTCSSDDCSTTFVVHFASTFRHSIAVALWAVAVVYSQHCLLRCTFAGPVAVPLSVSARILVPWCVISNLPLCTGRGLIASLANDPLRHANVAVVVWASCRVEARIFSDCALLICLCANYSGNLSVLCLPVASIKLVTTEPTTKQQRTSGHTTSNHICCS